MQAGRALDGEPCLPVDVADFVNLPEAARADLLPADELAGVEGLQQPHVPRRAAALLLHGAGEQAGRPGSS